MGPALDLKKGMRHWGRRNASPPRGQMVPGAVGAGPARACWYRYLKTVERKPGGGDLACERAAGRCDRPVNKTGLREVRCQQRRRRMCSCPAGHCGLPILRSPLAMTRSGSTTVRRSLAMTRNGLATVRHSLAMARNGLATALSCCMKTRIARRTTRRPPTPPRNAFPRTSICLPLFRIASCDA